jgi:hypothetical protein
MTFNQISNGFGSYVPPSRENIPPSGKKRSQSEPPEGSPPAKEARTSNDSSEWRNIDRSREVVNQRVPIKDTERAALNRFMDRTKLEPMTLRTLADTTDVLINHLTLRTLPCKTIYTSLANRINHIFCARIFKNGDPLDDFRDGRGLKLVISPKERAALKAVIEKYLLDKTVLDRLLDAELETVNGWLQEETDAHILRDHALRINQILNEKIFDTSGQRLYISDPVQVERSNLGDVEDIFHQNPNVAHGETPTQEMSLEFPLIFFREGYLPGRKVFGVNETEDFADVQKGAEQPRQATQRRLRKDLVGVTREARLKLQQYRIDEIAYCSGLSKAGARRLQLFTQSVAIEKAHLLNVKLFKEKVFDVDKKDYDKRVSAKSKKRAVLNRFLTPIELRTPTQAAQMNITPLQEDISKFVQLDPIYEGDQQPRQATQGGQEARTSGLHDDERTQRRTRKDCIHITREARLKLQQYSTDEVAKSTGLSKSAARDLQLFTQSVAIEKAHLLNVKLFKEKVFDVDQKDYDKQVSAKSKKRAVLNRSPTPIELRTPPQTAQMNVIPLQENISEFVQLDPIYEGEQQPQNPQFEQFGEDWSDLLMQFDEDDLTKSSLDNENSGVPDDRTIPSIPVSTSSQTSEPSTEFLETSFDLFGETQEDIFDTIL